MVLTLSLALGLALAGAPAPREAPVEPKVEIDGAKAGTLSAASFRRIRDFVLAQGKHQTWCNMFNDNPYYGFGSFDLFLNPPDQRNINCVVGLSGFPTVVVRSKQEPGRYWHITLAQQGERLTLTKTGGATKDLAPEVEAFFREALAEIQRLGTPDAATRR